MATKIVTKNSSTASAVPTASDLVQGELAVNVADKRLFTEDNAGAIVELGTNPTTLNVNGTATMDGLTVSGAQNSKVAYFDDSSEAGHRQLQFTSSNNGQYWDINSQGTSGGLGGVLTLSTRGSQRLTIDTSGNVGIGDTSPSLKLNVHQSTVGIGAADFHHVNGNRILVNPSYNYYDAYNHIFRALNGTSTHMTIDNSGNLLVGKSGTAFNSNGVELRPNGALWATVTGQGAASFNIKGTDGVITDFYKDGASVGSIFSGHGGTQVGIGTNTTGITFNPNTRSMMPADPSSTNPQLDATLDIGFPSVRWRSLYLSGKAIVGSGSFDGGGVIHNYGSDVNSRSWWTKTDTHGYGDFAIRQSTTQTGSTYQTKLLITSAGNVGIGTSSPSAALHVSASAEVVTRLSRSAGSNSLVLFQDPTTTTAPYIGSYGNAMAFGRYGGGESMRISSAGHTTFGTTNLTPADSAVNGTSILSDGRINHNAQSQPAAVIGRTGTDGAIAEFRKSGTAVGSIGTVVGRLSIGSGDTGVIFAGDIDAIYPANGLSARDNAIDIGSSGARFKDLYLSGEVIAGAGANNNPSITSHVDTDTGLFFGGGNILGFSTGGGERMRINSAGALLVGGTVEGPGAQQGIALSGQATDSNIYVRHANGTGSGSFYMAFTYNTSTLGSISQNGTSQVLYNISSDQRLKEDIVDAPTASDDIDAIQVRSFNWKADGAHQKYGMIAQELQAVAPEAVSVPEDSEEMMGVDYSKLVPMLIKEIQSLRNRVAQLEE